MDTERLDLLGVSSLETELTRIDAIADKDKLSAYFARSGIIGSGGPFSPRHRSRSGRLSCGGIF
jgi:predicted metalloendopeptidase